MKPLLEDVAGAILDGTAVDWNGVDSRAEQFERPVIEQLKTLAALRLVRRGESVGKPREWGHLRVLERIGAGAFGEVFRAWDTRLDREVALKLLPDESPLPSSSSIIEEGRLLARVRHPNVVTIYGAERIDGRIGLWMELVKGCTLEEALQAGTTFTTAEVTRIGVELCRAVSAVHAAGLLHRDIKAQNVMMAEDGRLVLMDFGTGRELDGTADANVTGTPLYLAPEVLAGGSATAQSDVYSVGVLLYHLLTGAYPVHASTLADLRRAHAPRQQPDLPDAARAIPKRLRHIVGRALDPDPGRRYGSAKALAAALSASAQAPSRRTVIAMAAAAAIVVTAGATWQFRSMATVDPVIAVMPFKNLSPGPDSEYFADGLTSEVIRNLAAIDGLQVRSQTSSFFFKDKPRDLRAIGEQLNANLIVEADVLRVGNRLRINAQLVPVDSDVPRWSKKFDRTLDDVFTIQDEISREIVNELRLNLGRGQRRYQTNLQAYEVYLRARAVRAGLGEERGAAAAVKLFEQVIAIDPAFAPAYAGLANAYQAMAWNVGVIQKPELLRPAARRAIELDPLLAEAHVAMGAVHTAERDWENAAKSFERALELNPNLPEIHSAYFDTLVLTGQKERALQLLERAMTMDPLSLTVRRDLAFAQFLNDRYADAITNLRRVLSADPEFPAGLVLARALMLAGRPEEAIDTWKNRPANPKENPGGWERWLARAYVMTGRTGEADRVLAEHRQDADPYHLAIIYAGLGDKERTFEALDRAADRDDHRAPAFLFSPETKFLRGDPRLDVLKRKLKLPVQ
jgi:serine/threonine protein kinase/tetratricopeptide (TPR) repeat protein